MIVAINIFDAFVFPDQTDFSCRWNFVLQNVKFYKLNKKNIMQSLLFEKQ